MEIRFNPDGKQLVTTDLNGTVKIWNVTSQGSLRLAPYRALKGHSSGVEKAVFSSDSRFVATAGWDRTARVWDVASGSQLLVLRHNCEVKDITFSTDGTRLTTVTTDGKVRVHFLDREKQKELAWKHVIPNLTPEEGDAYLEIASKLTVPEAQSWLRYNNLAPGF
jgi:WD40 repeat protein